MTLTDRLGGARSSLAFKAPCIAATTANITLSGEQTIDGVAVVDGDRVLVKDQDDAAENGIYEVRANNTWVRAADWGQSRDIIQGTRVTVVQGTVGQGDYELTTSGTIILGTTELTISAYTNPQNVDGPASSTDNAIAIWDGTSGGLLQDSGATIDSSGGITTPYINTTRGAIRVSSYMTTASSYVDQSAQLRQAFIDFFDEDTTHFDFEGRMVGISSQINLVCGVDDFTSTPSAPKNFTKRIVNGGIRWLGPDASGTSMLRMTCPTAISADAAFKEPGFESFRFDAGGGGTGYAIGCLEISNFYHLKFKDCQFIDFEDEVAVFLSSQDNFGGGTSVYTDDNGATFESCRWACINGDNQNAGIPIRAYCGDILVEGGWVDFCGPMDFHIGSVTLDRVHFVNNLGSPSNRRYAAIFRDPRAITLINNDCDGGVFKFTNAGYLDSSGITSGSPTHGAETSFRNILVVNNRFEGYAAITPGEGVITFETENASTTLTGGIVIADNATTQFDQGADATPFLKVIETGSGEFTSLSGVYRYVDAFGCTPGDTDFGAATLGVTSGSRFYSDDKGISLGEATASSDTDLTRHLDLYGGVYGINVTSNNLNFVANGSNTLSVRAGGIDASADLTLVGSDIFLSTGAEINFGSTDVTITHATNNLTFDGGSAGYTFSNGSVQAAGGVTFPSYAASAIADASDAVNTSLKAQGQTVFDATNNRLMVAAGSSDTALWYVVDGSTSVTPA